MLTISVDEAYAYDMLSILHVKQQRMPTDSGAQSYLRMSEELATQTTLEYHFQILASLEYTALVTINAALFDALEMIKRTDKRFEEMVEGERSYIFADGEWPGAAMEIDRMVYRRYLCKRALQERFFGDKRLTERKIGYAPDPTL